MRALFLAAGLAAAAPAGAADIAEHRVLGFSPDAGVFAFEEFGVQDGSGFPYSNIYFLDTASDSWLPGSPVRVLVEDERRPLADARARAREQAAALMEETGIEDRHLTLAHKPLGEVEASPVIVDFGVPKPWSALEDIDRRFRAELDIFYAESPGRDCVILIGDRPTAFRLKIAGAGGTAETILHEDTSIPPSRGCPISYRLTRIVVPDAWPVETVVVLVSVLRFGFEGADRRFVAVAGELPE